MDFGGIGRQNMRTGEIQLSISAGVLNQLNSTINQLNSISQLNSTIILLLVMMAEVLVIVLVIVVMITLLFLMVVVVVVVVRSMISHVR